VAAGTRWKGTERMVNGESQGQKPVWIALDAMGSDHGPSVTVAGALEGIEQHGVNVTLVGDEATLRQEVRVQKATTLLEQRLRLVHASEVATMEDKLSVAARRRNTSMRVACDLVKSGQAAAVVSAGNSGTFMAIALLVYGRVRGIMRPAIGALMPSVKSGERVLLLDAGANTDVAPQHLVQWAFVGDVYARVMQGRKTPRVAVLSNGEEDTKGTDLTRCANEALHRVGSALNYVGYCEGGDISMAAVDVVVTDGFTGNVVLKTIEGLGRALKEGLEARFRQSLLSKLQYVVVHNIFKELRAVSDYRFSGGAPLLGVNEVAIVAHGKSDQVALGHALRVAQTHVRLKLNEEIARAVVAHGELFPDAKQRAKEYAAQRPSESSSIETLKDASAQA
jgi:glycerol-3-phosphate acyltransferase PlsX